MKQENINSAPKKAWKKPDIYILDTYNINSGAQPGIHENNVVTSVPTVGGKFSFLTTHGAIIQNRNNTKAFYYS